MVEMACEVVANNQKHNQEAADKSLTGTVAGFAGLKLPPVETSDLQKTVAVAAATQGGGGPALAVYGAKDLDTAHNQLSAYCDKSAKIESSMNGATAGVGGTEKKADNFVTDLRNQAQLTDKEREKLQETRGF